MVDLTAEFSLLQAGNDMAYRQELQTVAANLIAPTFSSQVDVPIATRVRSLVHDAVRVQIARCFAVVMTSRCRITAALRL